MKNKRDSQFASLFYLLFFPMLTMSCNRPMSCFGKKCESKVDIINPLAAGASAEAVPQSPAATATPANDLAVREIKALKDRENYLHVVDAVENKLELVRDNYILSLESQVNSLIFVKQDLENKLKGERGKIQQLSDARRLEVEKNLSTLRDIASELAPQKIELLGGIEALEASFLDSVTPEGVKAQVDFDALIMKMDVARAQSDLSQIEAVKNDMKNFVGTFYVADKGLLNSLIDQLSALSVKMVSAHAPDQIIFVLEQIKDLEAKIATRSLTESPESLKPSKEKLARLKNAVLVPLKAIGSWHGEALVNVETGVQTAEKTAEVLESFVSFLATTMSETTQKVGVLKGQLIQVKINISNLKIANIETEANAGFILPALGTLATVLDRLQEGLKKLDDGFKVSIAEQIKRGAQGPDANSLENFNKGYKELEALLGEIVKATNNFKLVVSSKAVCSIGQSQEGALIPLKEISCSENKFLIINQ